VLWSYIENGTPRFAFVFKKAPDMTKVKKFCLKQEKRTPRKEDLFRDVKKLGMLEKQTFWKTGFLVSERVKAGFWIWFSVLKGSK